MAQLAQDMGKELAELGHSMSLSVVIFLSLSLKISERLSSRKLKSKKVKNYNCFHEDFLAEKSCKDEVRRSGKGFCGNAATEAGRPL